MTDKDRIENWIKEKQNILDVIISEAAEKFIDENKNYTNFRYDLSVVQNEMYNLAKGGDLCYDRPAIPLAYSLWYQGRRINGFLDFFIRAFLWNKADSVDVFDLGAGTGAAHIALGVVYSAFVDICPEKIPERIRIVNIDSSPFMLKYNENFLYPAFLEHFPNAKGIIHEFSINSWINHDLNEANSVWLTASYLFDISDQISEITDGFLEIIKTYRPEILFLTSSYSKKSKIDSLSKEFETLDYSKGKNSVNNFLLKGRMDNVNRIRRSLWDIYGAKGLDKAASWNGREIIYGKIFLGTKNSRQLSMVKLYESNQKARNRLKLSAEQKEASKFIGSPSKIVGSAGSGKTVVITEKVRQIVEAANYEPKLKILITTFNKALTKLIRDWLYDLLDKKKIVVFDIGSEYQFKFQGSDQPSIYVMHFDILPTRFGQVNYRIRNDKEHLLKLEVISRNYIQRKGIGDKVNNLSFLDPEFLWEEYQRVFIGKGIKTREEYLREFFIDRDTKTQVRVRQGRGKIPFVSMENRVHIYECILEYMNGLNDFGYSFYDVRRLFLKKLELNNSMIKFDYLFVDEFQDCTRTDFKIFYNLLKNPNNITITGDLAQSIHIGKSATSDLRAVKAINGITLKNIRTFTLGVSYRLPFRIAQSITGLSDVIIERWGDNPAEVGNLLKINPVKNAPPGARPIVVFGRDSDEMSEKIAEIIYYYQVYGVDKFTLLENDKDLASCLWKKDIKGRRDTILRLKGIENPLIIWSSRKSIDDKKEVYEFLYTIFTRTTSVLIIALFPDTLEEYVDPLKLFNPNTLIFWDAVSKSEFDKLKAKLKTLCTS